ncbi:MAG: cysteine peptidase family C39 domain-containing protein [Nanoarchaeota archaeon]|nr:cysteine peptidase family C39 domain-containing protein [Nanoarchaeota archaeon]
MIKLKPFKQSRGYCGPASLKMVLSAYNIEKTEDYLAKLMKTSRKNGCKEENIVKLAKSLKFKAFIKKHSSINEIKKLTRQSIPVIVNWFSPEEAGHYSVVIGFKKDNIFLADPHFGKIVKHKTKWFEERWFDLVNNKIILKEIIVIYR